MKSCFFLKQVVEGNRKGFPVRLTDLLLLVQHDVGFEAGDAGELFMANGAGEVGGRVCGFVEREVELHVERLWALVASMRLQWRKRKSW